MPFYMATGMINQPINTDDMYYKPGDSFTISAGKGQWAAICSSTKSLWWTIPLCKPVRSDVVSVSVSGGLAVRASGKGQTNLTDVTADSVEITACGLLCNYVNTDDLVSAVREVVNVSPRGTAVTVTFS